MAADENVFAEVKSEGNVLDIDKAFGRLEAKEDKTASESQPEKKETVEPSQGDTKTPEAQVPFHKHPRWQKTQETLKQYEARIADFEKKLAEKDSQTVEPPEWWKKQYGDTPESKQRYQQVTSKDGELDWIKQSILKEIDQRTQANQSQTKEAEEYVETQLQELTDEGQKFDRNTLLKFMVDFQEEFGPGSLLDAEGNYDFRKGLSLMQRLNPEQQDESGETKKALAAQASRSKSPTQQAAKIPVVSRRDLRRGWRDAGI